MKQGIFILIIALVVGLGSGLFLEAKRRPLDTVRRGEPFRVDGRERLSSGRDRFFSDPDSSGRLNTQRFALFIKNGQPLLFDTVKGELYIMDTDEMKWELIDLPIDRTAEEDVYDNVEKLKAFDFIFSSS